MGDSTGDSNWQRAMGNSNRQQRRQNQWQQRLAVATGTVMLAVTVTAMVAEMATITVVLNGDSIISLSGEPQDPVRFGLLRLQSHKKITTPKLSTFN